MASLQSVPGFVGGCHIGRKRLSSLRVSSRNRAVAARSERRLTVECRRKQSPRSMDELKEDVMWEVNRFQKKMNDVDNKTRALSEYFGESNNMTKMVAAAAGFGVLSIMVSTIFSFLPLVLFPVILFSVAVPLGLTLSAFGLLAAAGALTVLAGTIKTIATAGLVGFVAYKGYKMMSSKNNFQSSSKRSEMKSPYDEMDFDAKDLQEFDEKLRGWFRGGNVEKWGVSEVVQELRLAGFESWAERLELLFPDPNNSLRNKNQVWNNTDSFLSWMTKEAKVEGDKMSLAKRGKRESLRDQNSSPSWLPWMTKGSTRETTRSASKKPGKKTAKLSSGSHRNPGERETKSDSLFAWRD